MCKRYRILMIDLLIYCEQNWIRFGFACFHKKEVNVEQQIFIFPVKRLFVKKIFIEKGHFNFSEWACLWRYHDCISRLQGLSLKNIVTFIRILLPVFFNPGWITHAMGMHDQWLHWNQLFCWFMLEMRDVFVSWSMIVLELVMLI